MLRVCFSFRDGIDMLLNCGYLSRRGRRCLLFLGKFRCHVCGCVGSVLVDVGMCMTHVCMLACA